MEGAGNVGPFREKEQAQLLPTAVSSACRLRRFSDKERHQQLYLELRNLINIFRYAFSERYLQYASGVPFVRLYQQM